jgi:NAD-dependent deacetylase
MSSDIALTHPRLTASGRWKEAGAPRLVVLSGAGLSVESGLSLYRSKDGLWENHAIAEVCSWYTWKDNAEKVHGFYTFLREKGKDAVPHRGHEALAKLEAMGAVLVTQNVDTLLESAGARHVLHLHGRIDQMRCTACGLAFALTEVHADGHGWNVSQDRCPGCQSRRGVKPGVVFFGEKAPLYAPFQRMVHDLRPQDTLAVVGTSGEVIDLPALFPGLQARKMLFDPRPPTPGDAWFDEVCREVASEGMPRLEQLWEGLRGS